MARPTWLTQDVDVAYARDPENLKRLAEVLGPHRPYLRGAPPGLPFRWDAMTPTARAQLHLGNRAGRHRSARRDRRRRPVRRSSSRTASSSGSSVAASAIWVCRTCSEPSEPPAGRRTSRRSPSSRPSSRLGSRIDTGAGRHAYGLLPRCSAGKPVSRASRRSQIAQRRPQMSRMSLPPSVDPPRLTQGQGVPAGSMLSRPAAVPPARVRGSNLI